MNKVFVFVVLIVSLLILSAIFYRVSPDAGCESVLIRKPWIWGHGGVDSVPITTGATWCLRSTEHREFKVTPVTITEDFTNMIPSDNQPVSFAVYLKVQVRKGKTPKLHNDFSDDWYANNIQATFRTMVRDKASKFKMWDLASKREISSKLEDDIFKDLTEYTNSLNIPVDILQVSIGAITPPAEVLTETKLTAAQNQNKLTQDARATAELSRKQAEENKAISDMAYMKKMNMTIEQYLHLRQIEINKEMAELIKDNKNTTVNFYQMGTQVPLSIPMK